MIDAQPIARRQPGALPSVHHVALGAAHQRGRDAMNRREVEALHQLGERARDLRDELVGLTVEVANSATVDAGETGP